MQAIVDVLQIVTLTYGGLVTLLLVAVWASHHKRTVAGRVRYGVRTGPEQDRTVIRDRRCYCEAVPCHWCDPSRPYVPSVGDVTLFD